MLSQLKLRGFTWKDRWTDENDWEHMEILEGLAWICVFSEESEIDSVQMNLSAFPPFTSFEVEAIQGTTIAGWIGESV